MKLEELLPLAAAAKDATCQDDGQQHVNEEEEEELDDEDNGDERVLSRVKNAPATPLLTDDARQAGEDAGSCAGGGGGAEKDANGKKKGTRKKRSLNWEEAERSLLLEIIKPKIEFVENRSVDAKSIRTKRLTWTNITKQFNAHNFRHRLLEQIQVQWRSMKNTAKRDYAQKHPKSELPDGMRLVEFMEEMQKESAGARSQTRGLTAKKDLQDVLLDEDEDTPLAALPISINANEDPLQTTAAMQLPSPPPSTPSGESQHDGNSQPAGVAVAVAVAAGSRKRTNAPPHATLCNGNQSKVDEQPNDSHHDKPALSTKKAPISPNLARKRPRLQSSKLTQAADEAVAVAAIATCSNAEITVNGDDKAPNAGEHKNNVDTANAADEEQFEFITPDELDARLKRRLFRLAKQSRLAEMDNARREHEEKIRLQRMEMELKLTYYREEHDLKLRQMRDEFEIRLRQQSAEHEARMQAYMGASSSSGTGSGSRGCKKSEPVVDVKPEQHKDDSTSSTSTSSTSISTAISMENAASTNDACD